MKTRRRVGAPLGAEQLLDVAALGAELASIAALADKIDTMV